MDILKDILDTLKDSVIITDRFGKILLHNREARYIQEAIGGKQFQPGDQIVDFFSPEHKRAIAETLRRVKSQKKVQVICTENTTRSGSKIYLDIRVTPVLSPKRHVRYITVTTVDATAQKLFESSGRSMVLNDQQVLDNANAIIFGLDSQGYIVDWNKQSSKITGFDKDETYCRKMTDFLVDADHKPIVDGLMQTVLENRVIDQFELPLNCKGGHQLILHLSATPRTNAKGQVIGATLVGQDINELNEFTRLPKMKVMHG
jgi:PAS domain S-box-containing protein